MSGRDAEYQNRADGNTQIAFVGFRGHQGSEYRSAAELLRHVDVVGLVDTEVAAHEERPGRGSPPTFRSTTALLEAVVPDVAVVTVPHDQHYRVIAELVAAGCHVVVEKPLVPDVAEAERLYELSWRSNRSIVTLTQRPLRPEFRLLETLLPRVGERYWAQWTYNLAFPAVTTGWRARRRQARGGVFLDMGYHQIDVLCRLFGPARVTAASKHFRYPESQREDLEDLMSVSLEFERGGMSSHLLLSRHGAGKSETLEIHGTEGVIQLDARHARVTLFGRDGSVLDQYAGPDLATDSPAVVLGYYLELISDRQAALAHLRHHCSLVALCHEVYDAAARAAVGHHQSIERTEST